MDSPWSAALTGMLTGAALIIAIGAQNAYVLRQGIKRSHVLPIVAICALSDAVLIAAGVGGMGAIVAAAPGLITAIKWVGAVFLVGYGVLAARRALHGEHLDAAGGLGPTSLKAAVLTALAFTWLNPHVYLDTLVFLGSVATSHAERRWWFWAGASAASVIWFSGLGFGARLLGPLFAKPRAWRVLDGVIAALMVTLGVSLAAG
ncbi:LysE/ArgO family amino acid transporter [Nostocoides australiense]|nr:LysE/ArgO family amino acid transporter [Tetrasphaera australiensis]